MSSAAPKSLPCTIYSHLQSIARRPSTDGLMHGWQALFLVFNTHRSGLHTHKQCIASFGLSIIGTADDDHFHVPPCVYRLSSSIIPYGPALLSLRMIPWSATYVLCCFFFFYLLLLSTGSGTGFHHKAKMEQILCIYTMHINRGRRVTGDRTPLPPVKLGEAREEERGEEPKGDIRRRSSVRSFCL